MNINIFGYKITIERNKFGKKIKFPRWIKENYHGPTYFQLENTCCVGSIQGVLQHHFDGSVKIGVQAFYGKEPAKWFVLESDAKAYIEEMYYKDKK